MTTTDRPTRSLRRATTLLVALTLLSAVLSSPAGAVTNGDPDNGAHPNVGALILTIQPPGAPVLALTSFCSGTYVGNDMFLTAAHCTALLEVVAEFLPNPGLAVTFADDDFTGPPQPLTAEMIPATGFTPATEGPPQPSGYHDLAIVHLASTPDVAAASLPSPGYLNEASARGGMNGEMLRYVGYGVDSVDRSVLSPNAIVTAPGVRSTARSRYVGLTPHYLKLNVTHAATGEGGGCFGDSGGPIFRETAEGDFLVAITTGGPPTCTGVSYNTRLDTPEARAFLERFGL